MCKYYILPFAGIKPFPIQLRQHAFTHTIGSKAVHIIMISPYSYVMFIQQILFILKYIILFQPVCFISMIIKCWLMGNNKISFSFYRFINYINGSKHSSDKDRK